MARIIFLFIFITILSAASAAWAQEPPLQMPKEILGYWLPLSDQIYSDFNILPSGKIEQFFYRKDKQEDYFQTIFYKVVKIENHKIFLIAHYIDSPFYINQVPEGIHDYYSYLYLTHRYEPSLQYPILSLHDFGPLLTEQDWQAPVSVHQERLQNMQQELEYASSSSYCRC